MYVIKNYSKSVFLYTQITTDVEIQCPSDLYLPVVEGVYSRIATWDFPTVSGGYDLVDITSSHSSGDLFHIGSTEVEYSVYDKMDNLRTSCSFRVYVTGKWK